MNTHFAVIVSVQQVNAITNEKNTQGEREGRPSPHDGLSWPAC